MCWKFLKDDNSWSNVLDARVRRNQGLIKYSIKSSIWSSIKEYFETVMDNTQWLIGNGKKINFWLDNWSGGSLEKKFNILDIFHSPLTAKFGDFMHNNV